jgi:chemotaxis protein CheD
MSKHVEIHIAELFAGNEDYLITTNGVGSCVVIVLYDRLMRVGGMAHAILPRRRPSDPLPSYHRDDEGRLFAKYADQAIELLLAEIKALGGQEQHLVAKLVGGAHMFVLLEGDKHGIGFENTEAAREELVRRNIVVETEVIGGTVGRNVRFDCSTGIVEITTKV